jgi:nicotinate-nucleotide adenylyltransferase
LLPVSSTEIRQRVKSGKSIHGLVPEKIESIVKEYYL